MSLRTGRALVIVTAAIVATGVLAGSAPGKDHESKALLWSALGGRVKCGIANHISGGPLQLLCAARPIPAPKHVDPSLGDPGWVYLKEYHRPKLALISQYSWQKGARHGGYPAPRATHLGTGTKWKYPGLGVTCRIKAEAVRCKNSAGHGFTIGAHFYRAF